MNMGVNLSDLVEAQAADLKDLSRRTVAIDAYNAIYQFLSVIRQPDGTPLKSSEGEVTSHLSGLLYRNVNLIEAGVLPAYIFDGIPSEMKAETVIERSERRAKAQEEWKEAKARGDYAAAFTKATQSSRITNEIVSSSKVLLTHMGIPVVQAPEEGEAQAAYMASRGDVWAASSQDFDSLLFGAPRLVRNLTLTGRRKLPNGRYKTIRLEILELGKVLEELGINREQLIDVCILMGTDYNKGINGIGPKKGLKLILEHGDLESALMAIGEDVERYAEIRRLFLEFERTDDYDLSWRRPNGRRVVDLLCGKYDFSEPRVVSAIEKMERHYEERAGQKGQSRLDMF